MTRIRLDDAYQRGSAFALAAELIEELGGDVATVSAEIDLDLATLRNDSRIPFETCLALLDRAAVHTGCAHFGLLLGARYPWHAYGLIHDLALQAPTVRQGLLDIVTWQLGYSSGGMVYLNRYGPDFVFGYGVYGAAAPGNRQLYELCAAFGVSILAGLSDGTVVPTEVHFMHVAPADLAPYHRIFGAPLRFNQPQCCMILLGNEVDRIRTAADPYKRRHVEATINAALTRDDPVLRLQRLLRLQLFEDDASMRGAAAAMGMPVRTLRRKLAAQDTTFEIVRDEVRFMAARELLDMTRLPITEIATALAFASHSAFDQTFRRWSGISPTEWRRGLAGGISAGG